MNRQILTTDENDGLEKISLFEYYNSPETSMRHTRKSFDRVIRPVYIQNMACVVINEDMCSFGYLSVVHHRMRQTSSIALNERLKQTKKLYTI